MSALAPMILAVRDHRGAVPGVRASARTAGSFAQFLRFEGDHDMRASAGIDAVVLVAPLSGGLRLAAGEIVTPGHALLLGRPAAAVVAWQGGSHGIVVRMPRARLQAMVSERLGDARRVACVDRLFACSEVSGAAEAATASIVDALCASARDALPVARSVKRAADYIRSNSDGDCSDEVLAAVAGVTPAVLRRNFRACLGVPLGMFVQNIRLDAAHRSLGSCRDSRSVTQVAHDAGYDRVNSFSRAYHVRFGEAPSLTRARAVKTMPN